MTITRSFWWIYVGTWNARLQKASLTNNQARLTHIYGAHEDLGIDHVNRQLDQEELSKRTVQQSSAFEKFRHLAPWTWDEMINAYPQHSKDLNIKESLDMVLDMLCKAGHDKVYVHDLTKPDLHCSITKVLF